jgi:putative peptidoglycan lipid II flippase
MGCTLTPLRLLVAASLVNIALKIVFTPMLGAVGLALATSVGITVYATLLYRENRVRGFLTGPAPIPAGALVATGVGLGLFVLWSRDAVLRAIGIAGRVADAGDRDSGGSRLGECYGYRAPHD